MLTGQNGILNRAQEAKEKTEQAQEDEKKKLYGYDVAIKKYTGTLPESAEGQDAGTAIKNPDSYEYSSNAQATADGAGKYFALPTDASYVTGTVDTGVVVNIKGSEFVWVPVEDAVLDTSRVTELPTSSENGTSNGKTYTPMAVKVGEDYRGIVYNYSGNNSYLRYAENEKYQGGSTDYREPDVVSHDIGDYTSEGITLDILKKEYNAMIESVLKYKGFYVARYEAGIDTDNNIVFKNASQTENEVMTTDASNSQTYRWYGLYKKIKTFATTEDKFVSGMIWGSQYDAMMNWMTKMGKIVQTDNSQIYNKTNVTGYDDTDMINNIYDLYGCHYEWTMEAYYTYNRVFRGGYLGSGSPAYCNGDYPYNTYSSYSSRATLYIK